MRHVHPPIDFPLYGLDQSWHGPRWLAFVQGEFGEPIYEVFLGHGDRPLPSRGHPWLQVVTRSACFYPTTRSIDHTQELAWDSLLDLLNAVTPDLDDPLWTHYKQNAMRYIDQRVDRYRRWARTTWSVDGTPIEARYARFAGAWSGFASTQSDVELRVVGCGLSPQHLGFQRLASGEQYHFDLAAPIPYPDSLERAAREALGEHQWDRPSRALHSDQRRLLEPSTDT